MKEMQDAVAPSALIRQSQEMAVFTVRDRSRYLRDEVYNHYKAQIRSGILTHGDRIPPERMIAAKFDANRRTVREALRRLQSERMIERRRGSGSYVLDLSETTSPAPRFETPTVSPIDALEACRVFEPGLSELVVARATDDDFRRMAERLNQMEKAKNQIDFKEAGYGFHLEIARATRNPLLIAMYEMLIAARAKAGWETLIPLNDRQDLRDDQTSKNRQLFEAYRARDAHRAWALSHSHRSEMIRTVANFPANA